MKISDIEDGVYKLWNFIFPPTVALISMTTITMYVCGYSWGDLQRGMLALISRLGLMLPENAEHTFQFYGIDKLMPLIAFFGVLFVLHAVFVIVHGIGQFISPKLSHDPNHLLVKVAGDERLARIWARFPHVHDLDGLRLLIQQTTELEKSSELRQLWGVEYWRKNAAANHESFSTVKFLVVWSLAFRILISVFGLSVSISPARLGLVLLVLLILGVLFATKYFYAHEQLVSAELNGIDTLASVAKHNPNEGAEQVALLIAKIKKLREAREKERWWSVRIVDTYFFVWIYRTVRKHRRSR